MATGGKSVGVYVVTDAQLESNGGTFRLQPGPAVRISAVDAAQRGVTGSLCMPVYVVDDAYVAAHGAVGGKPLVVADLTSVARSVEHPLIATPVYVMEGTLGEAEAPVEPEPVIYEDDFSDGGAGVLNVVDTDWIAATGLLDEGAGSETTLVPFTQTAGGEIHINDASNNPRTSYSEYVPFVACADQWVEVVTGQPATGNYGEYYQIGVALRSNLATKTFIEVYYGPRTASDGYVYMYDYVNGNFNYIPPNAGAALIVPAFITGRILRCEVEGTTLRIYIDNVLIFTGTTQIVAAGKAGLSGYCYVDSADDQSYLTLWRAGEL